MPYPNCYHPIESPTKIMTWDLQMASGLPVTSPLPLASSTCRIPLKWVLLNTHAATNYCSMGFRRVTRYYYHIVTYRTSRIIPASACLLLKQYILQSLRDKTDKTFWNSLCCTPAHQTRSLFQITLFYCSSTPRFRYYFYVLWLQLSFGKVIYMLPCTGIIRVSFLLESPNDWLLQSCFICLW